MVKKSGKKMAIIIFAVLLCLFLLIFGGLKLFNYIDSHFYKNYADDILGADNPIFDSIGECSSYDYYSQGVFQDFTDYGKFYYDNVDVSQNKNFSKPTEQDIKTISLYISDFEGWVSLYKDGEASTELEEYDFDINILTADDYFYLDVDKETLEMTGDKFANYNLYILDSETKTLYFFHNNI